MLIALWNEGLTTSVIGTRLNVTKNAVVGKVHRLGLQKRGSPIKKKPKPAQVTSLDELKEFLVHDLETVSDPKMVLHRMVAEDDLVAFWATYSGIQDGPMGPYPATGKRMELDFAGMHRIADDKIVETWVIWDSLTGLKQLDLFPPKPPEAKE